MDRKLILVIGAFCLSIFSLLLSMNTYIHAGEVNVKDLPPLNISFDNNLSKLDTINLIANAVANEREYVAYQYDCTQFSDRLSRELRAIGFNAYCYAGLYGSKRLGHTWVEINDSELGIIEVEATGGFIIDNERFKINYEKFPTGKGFCY